MSSHSIQAVLSLARHSGWNVWQCGVVCQPSAQRRGPSLQIRSALDKLNITPPGPENDGSTAETPINCVRLLELLLRVNLICSHQPQVVR
jgi:hypothetical protein